jgi:2-isopropylmalate synthase
MPSEAPAHQVLVFDTTLRDGEQSPGVALNSAEKLEIASQLARLGVDVIEAGFPITSPGDFEAVRGIARQVEGPVICALARTSREDVVRAWESVRDSSRPRIHTFIATSDIHIERKLQTTREGVLGQARAAVAHARSLCEDVEFSAEDASRSDLGFLAQVVQAALDEGASTINLPDTVGYALPAEHAEMISGLLRLVPGLRDVVVSVHCHDDLGLAVANSVAGLEAGARQVECAVNGIGERAGNASLEEIVMLLRTRVARLGLDTGVDATELSRTSRLVSRLTGYTVQPNKAIVGRNAFAHEAGIHQDGVLKDPSTYEIMRPQDVGLSSNALVLGKHSGRHALEEALASLGHEVSGEALRQLFRRFKEVADRKGALSAMDLEALLTDDLRDESAGYELLAYEVVSASSEEPSARVEVRAPSGEELRGQANTGDGSTDALFRALETATGHSPSLEEFHIDAVTPGEDALGEVSVVLEEGGRRAPGQGVDTDILGAAARAWLRALSRLAAREG